MKHAFALILLVLCTGILHAQDTTIQAIKMADLVAIKDKASKTLVINFWSTWCKPCLEEIPHFISTVNSSVNDDVELWLVSLDTKKLYESNQLKEFIARRGWKAKFFWLNETDADVYCPLIDENWSGVLPATLITNPALGSSYFQEEAMTADALRLRIEATKKNDRRK